MRYYEVIKEDRLDHPDDIVDFIIDNCQPYLLQNRDLHPLYRGIKDASGYAQVKQVRTNRKPMDTSNDLTKVIDGALERIGSTALRTNSIFTTGSSDDASMYGTASVIFPIGRFSYTWSPMVTDMFNDLISPKETAVSDFDEKALDQLLAMMKNSIVTKHYQKHIVPEVKAKAEQEFNDPSEIKKAVEDHYYEFMSNNEMKDKAFEAEYNKIKELGQRLYNNNDYKADGILSKEYSIRSAAIGKINPKKLADYVEEHYIVNSQLERAIQSENEVLIKCNEYLAIQDNYYEENIEEMLRRNL